MSHVEEVTMGTQLFGHAQQQDNASSLEQINVRRMINDLKRPTYIKPTQPAEYITATFIVKGRPND